MKVAILDDYQDVALRLADWSIVARRAKITVFNDHVADPAALVKRLRPFDVVCVMRERTPLLREIQQQSATSQKCSIAPSTAMPPSASQLGLRKMRPAASIEASLIYQESES